MRARHVLDRFLQQERVEKSEEDYVGAGILCEDSDGLKSESEIMAPKTQYNINLMASPVPAVGRKVLSPRSNHLSPSPAHKSSRPGWSLEMSDNGMSSS